LSNQHVMNLPASTVGGGWRVWAVQAGVLCGAMGIVYLDVVRRLTQQWVNDPNFSHGFIVPLFSGFLVWQRKRELTALEIRSSWWGLVIMAAAVVELVFGTLGAELFLSRTSLVVLLAGMVVYLLGWKWLQALAFPWAFLFLMIPLPSIIFNQIAFPLQLLASRLATALLALLGVPVLREGNVIQLANMTLEVVEACSGIRSLVSLLTLALIYGCLVNAGWVRRALLAVAAAPIAVAANAFRITGTGLLGEYWDPDKAQGFFHAFSGWIIFVLSLGLLVLCDHLFKRVSPAAGGRPR
jgi:exosortase A